MLNTYSLKIKGIKKAASEMENTEKRMDGSYNQVNYNRKTGEVWVDFCLQNNWVKYNDTNIMTVGNYHRKLTMQELADEIKNAIEEDERIAKYYEAERI